MAPIAWKGSPKWQVGMTVLEQRGRQLKVSHPDSKNRKLPAIACMVMCSFVFLGTLMSCSHSINFGDIVEKRSILSLLWAASACCCGLSCHCVRFRCQCNKTAEEISIFSVLCSHFLAIVFHHVSNFKSRSNCCKAFLAWKALRSGHFSDGRLLLGYACHLHLNVSQLTSESSVLLSSKIPTSTNLQQTCQ